MLWMGLAWEWLQLPVAPWTMQWAKLFHGSYSQCSHHQMQTGLFVWHCPGYRLWKVQVPWQLHRPALYSSSENLWCSLLAYSQLNLCPVEQPYLPEKGDTRDMNPVRKPALALRRNSSRNSGSCLPTSKHSASTSHCCLFTELLKSMVLVILMVVNLMGIHLMFCFHHFTGVIKKRGGHPLCFSVFLLLYESVFSCLLQKSHLQVSKLC